MSPEASGPEAMRRAILFDREKVQHLDRLEEPKVSQVVRTAIQAALSGSQSVPDALNTAQKQITTILKSQDLAAWLNRRRSRRRVAPERSPGGRSGISLLECVSRVGHEPV